MPALRRNSAGTTWASGRAEGTASRCPASTWPGPATPPPPSTRPSTGASTSCSPPASTPSPRRIRVTRPGTVVLGLGLATLQATNGNSLIEVADVDGVSVAGVLLEAASADSPVLLRVGHGRSRIRHADDPTVLFDVYARIGGAVAGGATVSVQLDSNDVICDNLWLWRADHGDDGTVGWTVNPADTGLLVNGDRVTAYGLAVEHYQKYEVLWNGNHGRTYFFQNEHPYDVPTQSAWVHGSTNGYAAYKVADSVSPTTRPGDWAATAYFDLEANIYTDRAYEVPDTPGVVFTDLMIVCLNGPGGGGILHCINSTGRSGGERLRHLQHDRLLERRRQRLTEPIRSCLRSPGSSIRSRSQRGAAETCGIPLLPHRQARFRPVHPGKAGLTTWARIRRRRP